MITMISLSLLHDGLRLRRNSYVQGSLSHKNLPKKLAWTIWKSGLGSNGVRWQPRAQRADTPATVTGATTKERSQGLPRKKKCRKEGRPVPRGINMQSFIKWYRNAQVNKDLGRGQKRRIGSENKEEGGRGLTNRIEQPPRKQGKRGMHGQ